MSYLRLTGGKRLISPRGLNTRPTTAFVRKAVMSLLKEKLAGANWMDLCSGTGIMSCEALLRGVKKVVAVEKNRRCAHISKLNIKSIAQETASIKVVCTDLRKWLRQTWKEKPFDIIYFDPPYDKGLYEITLKMLVSGNWVGLESLLICEHRSGCSPSSNPDWIVKDQRRYGNSSIIILSRQGHLHDGIDSKPQQKGQ